MSSQITQPIHDGNDLSSIITWVEEDYIVLYSDDGSGRFFHPSCGTLTQEEQDNFFETRRVIYVDVSKIPSLCDDGEWNWYIVNKSKKGKECKCDMQNIVSHSTNPVLKSKFFFKL